jgi:hypothetical protein
VREYPFGPDDTVTLPALPRGDYEVDVTGLGIMPTRPVALSRGQVVELKMISFLDIAFIAVAFVAVLIGLVVARRPHLRSPAHIRVHAAGLAAGRRQAAARQSAGVIRIPVRRFPESDRETDAPASAEGAGKPVGETR